MASVVSGYSAWAAMVAVWIILIRFGSYGSGHVRYMVA